MHHFREADVPLLLEDVANMVSKQPGLTVDQAIAGLRGNVFRTRTRPTSGRRWRLCGGGWMKREFEEILEAHGYEVHRDGRAWRIVKAA